MRGHFDVSIDPSRKLLRIVLGGFFGVDDFADYTVAKDAALERLGCLPNEHLTLCDVSACDLQTQEVTTLFKQAIDDPRQMSRRLAIVVGNALARMQVRRILTREGAASFETVEDAERWLFEE